MFTPGPWDVCNKGKCHCKIVWARPADHPVAQVIAGEWGDDYPTIKLEGGSLDRTAKAVMEQITYGSVSEDVAVANAHLIAAAPDLFGCLDEAVNYLAVWASTNGDEKAATLLQRCTATLSKARGES